MADPRELDIVSPGEQIVAQPVQPVSPDRKASISPEEANNQFESRQSADAGRVIATSRTPFARSSAYG